MALSQIILELLKGLGVSVEIFAITLLFSLPLGLLVAFGRMSKNGVVSGLTKAYISIMRGTPLMLQLFVVYYGPYYLCHIKLSPTYRNSAVYIGFIINYAAYEQEVVADGDSLLYTRSVWGMWDMNRYLTLLMGEIPRLRDDVEGYGPNGKGYIAHIDIPADVIQAFEWLKEQQGNLVRPADERFRS